MLYNMNTDAIVAMLEGQLMPQPAMQLASVLAITYIGSKKLPKSWLKSTFQVCWRIMYEALVWLKVHNEMYADVIILSECLQDLPEDDIPVEILATIRHEENDDIARKEQEGYVPVEELQDTGKCYVSC